MHPEDTKHTNPLLNKLSTLLFYISIFIFIVALAFPHNPAGNWYQQFMPNLNNAPITDITFVDSLNGFATTNYRTGNDSAYILRTTNKGDTWVINTVFQHPFYRVQFINPDTGYALSFQRLFKTTNRGVSWQIINIPISTAFEDMYVLSIDTIWCVASNSLTGGVYRTTDSGASWQQQLSGTFNPSKIYMFNARIGFVTNGTNYIRKTTDGGGNWTVSTSGQGFSNMYFTDSLTGWRIFAGMKKTTDGGFNWVNQSMPSGGIILNSAILDFSNINKDTIWGAGGAVIFPNNQIKNIVYRTTNGGANWLFQIPDTNLSNAQNFFCNFVNRLNGWAYSTSIYGIHTITGGDTAFYLPVTQISSEIPKEYSLFQNYPNPFNPSSNIKYQIAKNKFVKLTIYNIQGKEIAILVNEEQTAGTYQVNWDASGFASGIYFYSLIIDNKIIETKKMLMVK